VAAGDKIAAFVAQLLMHSGYIHGRPPALCMTEHNACCLRRPGGQGPSPVADVTGQFVQKLHAKAPGARNAVRT
jgi:hypothetical protein